MAVMRALVIGTCAVTPRPAMKSLAGSPSQTKVCTMRTLSAPA